MLHTYTTQKLTEMKSTLLTLQPSAENEGYTMRTEQNENDRSAGGLSDKNKRRKSKSYKTNSNYKLLLFSPQCYFTGHLQLAQSYLLPNQRIEHKA